MRSSKHGDGGVSLDQFIASAVAEKVGMLRGAQEPQLVAAAGRSSGPRAVSAENEKGDLFSSYEAAADALDNGDPTRSWNEVRYWRWPTVTPPKVRMAEIIKRRAAKFPWIEQTDS